MACTNTVACNGIGKLRIRNVFIVQAPDGQSAYYGQSANQNQLVYCWSLDVEVM